MTTEAKFNPGQVVTTRPVAALMARDPAKHDWVTQQLARHLSGDWGDLDEDDAAMNDAAINGEDRIFLLTTYRQNLTKTRTKFGLLRNGIEALLLFFFQASTKNQKP